jgi:hypothetical protein
MKGGTGGGSGPNTRGLLLGCGSSPEEGVSGRSSSWLGEGAGNLGTLLKKSYNAKRTMTHPKKRSIELESLLTDVGRIVRTGTPLASIRRRWAVGRGMTGILQSMKSESFLRKKWVSTNGNFFLWGLMTC